MAHAVLAYGQSCSVTLVGQTVIDDIYAGLDFHPMQQLEGFLRLDRSDDGGGGRCRWYFALSQILTRQHPAGTAHGDDLIIVVGEQAFITCPLVPRPKNTGNT